MLEQITNLMMAYAKPSIIIVAVLVTLFTTLVTKYFTNQNRMKELKDIQKACRIQMKDNKGNPQELEKINKQVMECSMEMMKHSFKPMFITFIPLLILIYWLRGIYTIILPGWIWWYIISSVIASIALRKLLKVV
ncbi:DUF106 domain-containing protein [Candidatus Pacearchaeota archaeon]|nr:DUF106 domain-containing protein [Candidatus Pacearchaeota archaeon]